jgi:hypothetical protein
MRKGVMSRMAATAGLACLFLLMSSCARVPAGESATRSKVLAITVTLRGPVDISKPLNGGNYYFFLIHRTDNINDPGPIAVIAPPWGNGFAAPAQEGAQGFVGFVEYSRRTQSSLGGYKLYQCATDSNGALINPTFNQFIDLGAPDRVSTPASGDVRLSFEVNLARLPNSAKPYLLINMIATDARPAGAQDTVKRWDALGSGRDSSSRNYIIRMDSRQNLTLRNTDVIGTDQEPSGDVLDRLNFPPIDDPSLDIVDWTVTLRDS